MLDHQKFFMIRLFFFSLYQKFFQRKILALVLAASMPAEFSVRVLAEASRSAFEVAQEDIAFIPSSSACGEKVGFVLKSNKILDVEKTFCSPVCRQRTPSCSS